MSASSAKRREQVGEPLLFVGRVEREELLELIDDDEGRVLVRRQRRRTSTATSGFVEAQQQLDQCLGVTGQSRGSTPGRATLTAAFPGVQIG